MQDDLIEDEKSKNLKSRILLRFFLSLILAMAGAILALVAFGSNTVRALNGEHLMVLESLDLIDLWWALASLSLIVLALVLMPTVSGKEEKL